VRGYEPTVIQGSYYWNPTERSGVRLGAPVPYTAESPQKWYAETRPLPKVQDNGKEEKQADQTPLFPVGIPQFALARDGIAVGLKPSIDGLDWLKEAKYRTVLHLVQPGTDDSADRKQVEKRGLIFLSLEVSPAGLSQKTLDEFSRALGDTKGQPLFIYDNDGMLAGGLWYLHFRTVEKDSDEASRIKAGRLGLKDDPQGDHKAMWAAIKTFLSAATN
jgi:hypothetical protein